MEAAGIDRLTALTQYSGYFSASLPTIAASLAFWRERVSHQPLSLCKLLTASRQRKLDYLEATEADWEAFQRRYFASDEWRQL